MTKICILINPDFVSVPFAARVLDTEFGGGEVPGGAGRESSHEISVLVRGE